MKKGLKIIKKEEKQEEVKLPLHRKYRPNTFDDLVGNEKTLISLKTKVERKETTTYLLQGPRGTGKTTLARIIANELGVDKRNYREYDIGDTGGIEEARKIKKITRFAPLGSGIRVIVLDEIQGASSKFFEGMLKVLEEPPKSNYFILCTTDPQKLPKPIKSRCAIYQTELLTNKQIEKHLQDILKKEKIEDFPNEAIKKIAQISEGNPREALINLDKVIDIEDDEELLTAIEKLTGIESQAKELVYAILNKQGWKSVKKLLTQIDEDPEGIRRTMLGFLGSALMKGWSKRSDKELIMIGELFEDNFYDSAKWGLYSACYLACEV